MAELNFSTEKTIANLASSSFITGGCNCDPQIASGVFQEHLRAPQESPSARRQENNPSGREPDNEIEPAQRTEGSETPSDSDQTSGATGNDDQDTQDAPTDSKETSEAAIETTLVDETASNLVTAPDDAATNANPLTDTTLEAVDPKQGKQADKSLTGDLTSPTSEGKNAGVEQSRPGQGEVTSAGKQSRETEHGTGNASQKIIADETAPRTIDEANGKVPSDGDAAKLQPAVTQDGRQTGNKGEDQETKTANQPDPLSNHSESKQASKPGKYSDANAASSPIEQRRNGIEESTVDHEPSSRNEKQEHDSPAKPAKAGGRVSALPKPGHAMPPQVTANAAATDSSESLAATTEASLVNQRESPLAAAPGEASVSDSAANSKSSPTSPVTEVDSAGVAPTTKGNETLQGTRSTEQSAGSLTSLQTSRFINRVAKAFEFAQERGGVLKLRLSPPELGAMRLEVVLKEGAVVARVETETTVAKTILLDNLGQLRERLAEQNIRIETFDIDVNDQPSSREGSAGERERDSEDSTAASTSAATSTSESESDVDQLRKSKSASHSDSELDLVA
ncbi:MAG: flagellar hook-length control protein FliK [Pirellulales bacterium]|nr:flagellar hook-length control protein FliK [Pirellulales bacterium]